MLAAYISGILFICMTLTCGSPSPHYYVSKAVLRDGIHETNIFINGIRFIEMKVKPKENITE